MNRPDAAPKGDWKSTWNGLNTLTKGAIVLIAVMLLLGNPIVGLFYIPVFFFWFAPWTADFAQEHSRSTDWGYFFGFMGLLFIVIYWAYVRVTPDPDGSPAAGTGSGQVDPGLLAVSFLSLGYTVLSLAHVQEDSDIVFLLAYIATGFIMGMVVLYIAYLLVSRLYPRSSGWGFFPWTAVLFTASLVMLAFLGFCIETIGGGAP